MAQFENSGRQHFSKKNRNSGFQKNVRFMMSEFVRVPEQCPGGCCEISTYCIGLCGLVRMVWSISAPTSTDATALWMRRCGNRSRQHLVNFLYTVSIRIVKWLRQCERWFTITGPAFSRPASFYYFLLYNTSFLFRIFTTKSWVFGPGKRSCRLLPRHVHFCHAGRKFKDRC